MNHKTIYRAVLAFTLLASLVFGVFMTLSIAQSANGKINDINAYSADKVKFFNLISGLYYACLIGFLFFTFIYKTRFSKSLKFAAKQYKNTCILGGCTAAGVVLYSIMAEFTVLRNTYYSDDFNSVDAFYRLIKRSQFSSSPNYSYILLILATACAAFYFLYCVFSKKNKPSTRFAALSLFPALTLAAKLIFDFLMQNSNGYGQLYNYHLLSLGFFLLFFINESRVYMRRAAPALYVFFGLAGALSAAIFALPVLLLTTFKVVHASAANLMFCIADVAIISYIYLRLYNLEVKIPKATKEGVLIDDSVKCEENDEGQE